MKLTLQEKLKATKEHVDGKLTIKEVCEKYKIDPARIKYYTKLYRAYGEKPFMNSDHLQYTRETKLKMIKRCLAGESAYKLSFELGTPDRKVVGEWVALYKAKGEKAIQTTNRRKNYLIKDERVKVNAQKRLVERNNYLEAENEVLKKWYSLILQRSELSEKK